MKIIGPLLSNNAHGSVANLLTFSKKKTHQHARNKQQSNKVITPRQQEWRFLLDFVSLKWASMSDEQKLTYSALAKSSNKNLTGFQMFASYALKNPKDYLDLLFCAPHVYETSANEFTNYADPTYNFRVINSLSGAYKIVKRNTRKTKYTNRLILDRTYFTTYKTKLLGLTDSEFSITIMVKLIKWVETCRFFYVSESGNYASGFQIYMDEDLRIKSAFFASPEHYYLYPYTGYKLGEQVLITMTYKNGIANLYVNENLGTTTPNMVPNMAIANNVLLSGWHASSSGNIAEYSYVNIFNRQLSSNEVAFLYKSLKTHQGDK